MPYITTGRYWWSYGCVREAWGHAAESCRGLWRDAFPLLTKPWLALDWWGRSCLCSLIHHALYLDFRGKEKGEKDRIKEKRLPEISEEGAGVLKVELEEAPCSALALLPCPPSFSLSWCWKRSLTLVTPLPFSTPSTDNKRQIKPNGVGQI